MALKIELSKIGASTVIKSYPDGNNTEKFTKLSYVGNYGLFLHENVVSVEGTNLNFEPSTIIGHETDTPEELFDWMCEQLLFTEQLQ